MMRPDVVGRFRNSFAALLLELLDEPASPLVEPKFDLPFSSMTESDWRRAVQLWRAHAAELLASVPARACPACGCPQGRWLFESYDSHQFHECRDCGCWYTPKVVDWAVFERLFEISPEARAHAAGMMKERDDSVRTADMARIGAYLDELIPCLTPPAGRPIAYLDAGCGVGHSLRAGLERGLVVQGVDVDDAAVALARKAGLPVALPSEIDAMPGGPYQLLTFWETLEHIAEPLEAILRFVPFLAEDGLVAITVPNLNAPATRIMREACAWVHGGYNTPGHVNLFHVHALERLLERAGLALIDAQGQFSGNPEELIAFLGGHTHGAFDLLEPSINHGRVPAYVGPLFANASPGMALIEEYTLSSPILRVIACRRGRESSFSAVVAARRASRTKRITDTARSLLSFEPDARQLQTEIDRRDELLREKEMYFQGEIQRRDRMLTELRTTWESSVSFKLGRLVSKLSGRG